MSGSELLLVAIGGGVGAALRFVLDGTVRARTAGARTAGSRTVGARTAGSRAAWSWLGWFPLGTLIINVSGSFVLGVLTGLGEAGVLVPSAVAVLGTGMMGGYTTFSTASVETVQLFRSGRTGPAVLNGLGMLVVSVGAAALGLYTGRNS